MGDDGIRYAVYRSLQNKFIVGVTQLRSDSIVKGDMNCSNGEAVEKVFDTSERHSMDKHLIRSRQHILVFGQKRLRDQDAETAFVKSIHQATAGTCPAAEGGDDDRGVEDEAHGRRVAFGVRAAYIPP